jgi:hypothetical protein
MITNGWEFMTAIKFVTNEAFDEEAVAAIEAVVREWQKQISATSHPADVKIQGALYQGALIGMQIAARGRRMVIEKFARETGVNPETGEKVTQKPEKIH